MDIPVYDNKETQNKYKVLIFSGGAIKGIAHIGALKALEVQNILPYIDIYAGSSVGALIAAMFLIGYSPDEMIEFVLKFDFGSVQNISLANLMINYGLDSGEKLIYVLRRLIKAKGIDENITLEELYNKTKKELYITTVCLNNKSAIYMSHKTHPSMSVCDAVRMSISIPIFYSPKKDPLNKDIFYIDGGCIDNYPIHIFNHMENKVLGIFLVGEKGVNIKINNVEDYIKAAIDCLLEGVNYNCVKGYEKQTVYIKVKTNGLINYKLNKEDKLNMFFSGFSKTIQFLSDK